MSLIAKVAVVAMVDGQRREFAPGDELPKDLHPHDIEALKAMGSIEDVNETERQVAAKKKQERAAAKDFESARAAVRAANESTATPPAGDGSGASAA